MERRCGKCRVSLRSGAALGNRIKVVGKENGWHWFFRHIRQCFSWVSHGFVRPEIENSIELCEGCFAKLERWLEPDPRRKQLGCGSTIALSLTLQEEMAVLHALDRLTKLKDGTGCLLERLRFAIDEKMMKLPFSERELPKIIEALELALKESRGIKADYYGTFSLAELEGLLEKVEEASSIFQAKGA